MHLVELQTFVRVAETGSIAKAAKALGLPRSTISRRITRLEEELGIALLRRAPRKVSLTDLGRRLHDRSAAALRELEDLEAGLRVAPKTVAGHLRVTAPNDLGAGGFFPALLEAFHRAHPAVTVDLVLTGRVVDLVEEGFDIALRPRAVSPPLGGALMSRSLGRLRVALFASPAYLADAPPLRSPADLAKHSTIIHSIANRQARWSLRRDRDGVEREVQVEPTFSANDYSVIASLVSEGSGVSALPVSMVEAQLGRGTVERVLPAWSLPGGELVMVWPSARHLSPTVRAFIDQMTESLPPSIVREIE